MDKFFPKNINIKLVKMSTISSDIHISKKIAHIGEQKIALHILKKKTHEFKVIPSSPLSKETLTAVTNAIILLHQKDQNNSNILNFCTTIIVTNVITIRCNEVLKDKIGLIFRQEYLLNGNKITFNTATLKFNKSKHKKQMKTTQTNINTNDNTSNLVAFKFTHLKSRHDFIKDIKNVEFFIEYRATNSPNTTICFFSKVPGPIINAFYRLDDKRTKDPFIKILKSFVSMINIHQICNECGCKGHKKHHCTKHTTVLVSQHGKFLKHKNQFLKEYKPEYGSPPFISVKTKASTKIILKNDLTTKPTNQTENIKMETKSISVGQQIVINSLTSKENDVHSDSLNIQVQTSSQNWEILFNELEENNEINSLWNKIQNNHNCKNVNKNKSKLIAALLKALKQVASALLK
jgi:hypothetical protein